MVREIGQSADRVIGMPGAPLIAYFAMSGISRGKTSSMNWGLVRPWIQEALDAVGCARNDI
jgi:hypothetical protein